MKRYIILAAIPALLFSCKKSRPAPQNPASSASLATSGPAYFPLEVGNYWVYQYFDIDESGIATATAKLDSCYISEDTIIRGRRYFRFHEQNLSLNQTGALWLADSGNCVTGLTEIILSYEGDGKEIKTSNVFLEGTDTIYTAR